MVRIVKDSSSNEHKDMPREVVARGLFYLENGVVIRHEIEGQDTKEFRDEMNKLLDTFRECLGDRAILRYGNLCINMSKCDAFEITIMDPIPPVR